MFFSSLIYLNNPFLSIPAIFNDPANLDLSTMNDFVKQSLDDIHMGIGSNEVYFTIIKDDEFGDQVSTFS